jgi:AmmeMemoRadiSam system protein A
MLPLTEAARRWLLEAARAAVDDASRGRRPQTPSLPADFPPSDREFLSRPVAAFVTLTRGHRLRGCVGHTGFDLPLLQVVLEMAEAAALEDLRFDPVRPAEVAELQIEISVLSPFFHIEPEQVEPGKHGLVIRQGMHRGLLLPQVAASFHWDSRQFLQGVCQKAGLPPDAWKRGATLEAFTAEVIVEESVEAV